MYVGRSSSAMRLTKGACGATQALSARRFQVPREHLARARSVTAMPAAKKPASTWRVRPELRRQRVSTSAPRRVVAHVTSGDSAHAPPLSGSSSSVRGRLFRLRRRSVIMSFLRWPSADPCQGLLRSRSRLRRGGGLEPTTCGFGIRCSTN